MQRDPDSTLVITATKPKGRLAALLAKSGATILPVEDDEGNVDRYILSKRLVIERRTGNSFLRGIMDKSLFTSAIYLREHFEVAILLIEGEVNYAYTAFNPQAVRGALASMMLLYGISVLSTPTTEETVALIMMMASQEQVGIPEISLIPKRKATDLADMQRRIVEMLPGCGMVMARDLLHHFGSVKRIVNATEKELRGVRGIGARKATEMFNVLRAEYEAVDTERNLEDAIEAAPELLFRQPVILLDRQHYIYTEAKERHVVDLVFLDPTANELILVELKRSRLQREHERQILRYLNHASESPLLRDLLQKGAHIRGVLGTIELCNYRPQHQAITVCIVDKEKVIHVLKRLRDRRFAPQEPDPPSTLPEKG